MVKRKTYPRIEREVCRYVVLADLDLAVLNIFRMDELDLIDHVQFAKEHGANQTVEITSRYKAHLFICHKWKPP